MIECYRVLFVGNAPYVPTRKKLINKILEAVDFKEKALVYELGCGSAKFLRSLAKTKDIQAIGYEYFIMPYIFARLYCLLANRNVKIYYQDFFKADLSQADYIFCFLIDKEMARLEGKLIAELKPGALVISNTFKFTNWEPIKIVALNENKKLSLNNRVFIYRK
ncbi:MAG: class I SAM-dependent methyltransferase [Patescibacteria group bacterium]